MNLHLVNFFNYLLKVIKVAVIVLIVLTIILIITQFIDQSTPLLSKLNAFTAKIDRFINGLITHIMPTRFKGRDWSLYIILFLLFIVNAIIANLIQRLDKSKFANRYEEFRQRMTQKITSSDASLYGVIQQLDKKFSDLSHARSKDRKTLLKEFVALKNKLDNMGQDCAFLSIDVVNSFAMKCGDEKLLAIHDFDKYNEMAKNCLLEHGVIKFTTTPDGIMSCFRTVDDAVRAAMSLINKIKNFNLHEKQISRDFQIRCGINAGFVYIEGLPLEQVTDHVIDIAGHMQKNARPNSINIAGSAIEPLKTRGGFRETTDVIDEQRVYVWHEDHVETQLDSFPEKEK